MAQTHILRTVQFSPASQPRTVIAQPGARTLDMHPAPEVNPPVAPRPLHLIGGRYRLDAKIGEGSFATVWQARDMNLDRDVALKVFSAGTITPAAVGQVLREARASGKIVSDHVIRINNSCVDTAHNVIAIDMELCREFAPGGEARNGYELAKRVGCSPREAARWVMQAARGVDEAHSQNVFHRDLKTANILVRPVSERAQVVDFGLAGVHVAPPRAAGAPYVTVTIDLHGNRGGLRIAGTPEFMAPEQAAGLPLLDPERRVEDRQLLTGVDVYGLGAVLFELLTGRAPHAAPDTSTALSLACANTAWVRVLAASRAPRALRDIVSKALSSRPAARYASAGKLADDLEAYLAHRPTLAEGRRPLRRVILAARRRPAVASLIAMVLFAIGLSVYAPIVVTAANAQAASAQHKESIAKEGRDRANHERKVAEEAMRRSDRVATSARDDYKNASADLERANARLASARTQAEVDAATASRDRATAAQDAALLRGRVVALEADVQQRDALIGAERQTARAERDRLNAAVQRANDDVGARDRRIGKLENTVGTQQATIDDQAAELGRQQTVIQDQAQTIDRLRNRPVPAPTTSTTLPAPEPTE